MNPSEEPINLGKKSYREYLVEGYGRHKARYILDPKSRNIIDGIKRADAKRELEKSNNFLFDEKEPPK